MLRDSTPVTVTLAVVEADALLYLIDQYGDGTGDDWATIREAIQSVVPEGWVAEHEREG